MGSPAIDRLSELPESVLTHLLSFLTTEECVATSILSRRWRFLWQYVPVIDISDQDIKTVSRVVARHKAERLDAFRLSFDNSQYRASQRQFERWVITAVKRNVGELFLSLDKLKYVLPSPLFTCQTLVELRLERCCLNPLNLTRVSLPHLKNLLLNYIRFKETDSLTRLIAGCPVLEEMQIQDLIYGDKVEFIISSTTMKRLKLQLCFDEDNDLRDYFYEYTVELNTQGLQILHINDRLCDKLNSGPLPSLIEADIEVLFHGDEQRYVDSANDYYRSVFNFIDKLSEAKSLRINVVCLIENTKALFAAWTPTSFYELTTLDLDAKIGLLPKFLQSANNLERLHFQEGNENLTPGEDWIDLPCVPTCLLSSLKTIQLQLHGWRELYEGTFEMVRYLLKNALVLETMEIKLCHNTRATVDEISRFERRSNACQLRFI